MSETIDWDQKPGFIPKENTNPLREQMFKQFEDYRKKQLRNIVDLHPQHVTDLISVICNEFPEIDKNVLYAEGYFFYHCVNGNIEKFLKNLRAFARFVSKRSKAIEA